MEEREPDLDYFQFARERESRRIFERQIIDLTRQIKAREVISAFKIQAQTMPRSWCTTLNPLGENLLQTAITSKNRDAFDLLLPFYDIVSLEGRNLEQQSALMVAVVSAEPDLEMSEYFVTELIKNGAFIHTRCETNGETCLHKVVLSPCVNIVRLLLEKGVDVNVKDRMGNTALHTVLRCDPEICNEMVSLLMYYNADPLIENEFGLIPFHYAVEYHHEPELEEVLFDYTFDEDTSPRINIETVIQLCHIDSPLFSQILKYKMKVYVSIEPSFNVFFTLLYSEHKYVEILARKCSSALGKIIWWTSYNRLRWSPSNIKILASRKGIKNLGVLRESKLKPLLSSFIQNLNGAEIVTEAVHNTEEVATEILLFFLSEGTTFGLSAYHAVYERFGYCRLLKLLLYMGLDDPHYLRYIPVYKSTMPRFIYDFKYDINTLLSKHRNIMKRKKLYLEAFGTDRMDVSQCPFGNTIEVSDYFVDPKLADFLREVYDAAETERMERQPKVPLLLELARNSFRKHLVTTFGITSTCQFYSYIDKLPISHVHKKIITYETKLY